MNSLFSSFRHFQVLDANDISWMESVAQTKTYKPGQVLIEPGKFSDYIYICANGSLKVSAIQPDGSQQQLMELMAGELAGETFLIDDRENTNSVIVNEPAELLVIPKEKITQRLQVNENFAASFYHLLSITLSERLRKLTKLMATQNIKEGEPLRKALVVFAILNDSDVAWMVGNGVAQKAAPGTALITQNEEVPAIYLLLDGTLGIYINIGGNGSVQEKEVAQRVKGEILGEMSFVDGGNASATVRALENTWILGISQQKLITKFKEDRKFASRFYRSIALILSNRCLDLLVRGSNVNLNTSSDEMLSDDLEIEDELDLDVLEGTAIAGRRFDWIINHLRR